MTIACAQASAAAEVFTATATVKTADGKSGSAPITITIDRTMPESEAAPWSAAFKSGGAAALRKALVGVAPTGIGAVGDGKATPTRLTIERATGGGRLLTIVTDQPLVFIGAASRAPSRRPATTSPSSTSSSTPTAAAPAPSPRRRRSS